MAYWSYIGLLWLIDDTYKDVVWFQMETECAVAEVIASSDNIVIEDSVGNIEDVVAMETQEILDADEFLENHEILAPTQCKVKVYSTENFKFF